MSKGKGYGSYGYGKSKGKGYGQFFADEGPRERQQRHAQNGLDLGTPDKVPSLAKAIPVPSAKQDFQFFAKPQQAASESTETTADPVKKSLNFFFDSQPLPASYIFMNSSAPAQPIQHDRICYQSVSYTHLTLPTKRIV